MKSSVLALALLLLTGEMTIAKSNKEIATREEATEVMIAKAEDQAIAAIQRVIERKKGTPEEPDLLFRLAEMYLRRAKTSRFFEMHLAEATKKEKEQFRWSPSTNAVILKGKSKEHVEIASANFEKLEKKYPNYPQLDSVYFYQGFCDQQLAKPAAARSAYMNIVRKYPNSRHLLDARTALGEMSYDEGKFSEAIEHFEKVIAVKDASAVPYAMYKSAWAEYNMKRSDHAFEILKKIIQSEFTNPKAQAFQKSLRPEIIKDLALFFSDDKPVSSAIVTFQNLVDPKEFAEIVGILSGIYISHSRHKDAIRLVKDASDYLEDQEQKAALKVSLAETYEILKDMPSLIATLKEAEELCKPAHAKAASVVCDEKLPHYVTEFTQKLWESWKKGHKEQRITIEELFQLQFRLKPAQESKAALAYAEFLFQAEDYAKASSYYEKHSDALAATQPVLSAEALYSSLAAAEKISDSNLKAQRKTELSEKYLNQFPQGANAVDVQFQLGYLAYLSKDHAKALKYLMMVQANKKGSAEISDLKEKSQDLILDIYNAGESFELIIGFCQEILKSKPSPTRTAKLHQLIEEADFANIPHKKGVDSSKVDEIYYSHYKKNPNTKLGTSALWLAFSNAVKNGAKKKATDYGSEYAEKFPTDERSKSVLQQVAIYYLDYGMPRQALQALRKAFALQKPEERKEKVEALIELGTVTEDPSEISKNAKLIGPTLQSLKPQDQARIYARQVEMIENSKEVQEMEAKILQLGIEPYVSDVKLRQLNKNSSRQSASINFQQAKGIINSSSASSKTRALARLIQAQILIQEFTAQSTKTGLSKLPVVIALKTEKLAKAQEALLSAAGLSQDVTVQSQVAAELDQIYSHYIDSMQNLIIKDALSPAEEKELKTQIAELVRPISEKRADLRKKSNVTNSASKTIPNWNFSKITSKESLEPLAQPLNLQFQQFNLANWNSPLNSNSVKSCLAHPSVQACQSALHEVSQQPNMEKLSVLISALSEMAGGHPNLAGWILNQGIEKYKEFGPFYLARGFTGKSASERQNDLAMAYSLGLRTGATIAAYALNQYSSKNCDAVISAMKEFPSSGRNVASIQDSLSTSILSECQAIQGDKDLAYKTITKELSNNPSLESALQAARVAEDYLIDFAKARVHYELAFSLAQKSDSSELKTWLRQKLNYLSSLLPASDSDRSKERKSS